MSPPKTTGKTGGTGKPRIDAGFRASGLQKPNREKPGIRGAGDDGPGAEMATLALPVSPPPPRKPGRPAGAKTKAMTPAMKFALKYFTKMVIDGMAPTKALQAVAGERQTPEETIRRNYYRYFDRCASQFADADKAVTAMNEMRQWLYELLARWRADLPAELAALESESEIRERMSEVVREGLQELARRASARAQDLRNEPSSDVDSALGHGGVIYFERLAESIKPKGR